MIAEPNQQTIRAGMLGDLRVVEVYVYYDQPRLFAARNQSDQLFLVLWIDETDDGDCWLVTALSPRRFEAVRSGGLGLYVAFHEPETGYLFRMRTPFRSTVATVIPVLPESVQDSELPEFGTRLPAESTPAGSEILTRPDPGVIAKQLWRPTLDLRLDVPHRYGSRAPVRPLAEVLMPLQDTIDMLVSASSRALGDRGKLPENALRRSEMAVEEKYPGSFGLILTATTEADMFGNAEISDAFDRLVDLVQSGSDQKALLDLLRRIPGRAARKYRALLAALIRLNAGVSVKWAAPGDHAGRAAALTLQDARDALRVVDETIPQEPEVFDTTGELVGLNSRLLTFEISELETGMRYSGRVLDGAPGITHAVHNRIYLATIEKSIEVNPVTAQETIKWKLLGLRDPETERADPAGALP